MYISKADTCAKLIDPALQARGWGCGSCRSQVMVKALSGLQATGGLFAKVILF